MSREFRCPDPGCFDYGGDAVVCERCSAIGCDCCIAYDEERRAYICDRCPDLGNPEQRVEVEQAMKSALSLTFANSIILTPRPVAITATHRLDCFGPGHRGATPHEHTWWLSVTFAGKLAERGLLVDFDVVPQLAAAHFDGADLCHAPAMRGRPPTSENLLMSIVEVFDGHLRAEWKNACVARVRLVEGPTPEAGNVLIWTRPGFELILAGVA